MVTTAHRPAAGRHRGDQASSTPAPQRTGRGRHVAAPDHPRRRRIIGLGVVTVATAVALPVVTGPRTTDVAVDAWQRLGGAPARPSTDGSASPVAPSPGPGAHRREDQRPKAAGPADPTTTAPGRPPLVESTEPTAPAPPGPPPEPPDALTATYRVVWGDTLTSIGAEHAMTWRQVFDANADVIGADPNLVVVGTVLRVRPT